MSICPPPFEFDEGRCRYVVSTRIFDDLGHEADGDADPKAMHGCRHTHTPEYRKAHQAANKDKKLKERPMEELHQGTDAPPHAEPPHTHESVGVAAFDLTKVLPEGGAISPLAATLGGLAIVSGVALKVVPSWLRGRTEMATQRLALKAKRMELEQKSKEQQQSGDCASSHAACLAAIATLEERVKLVERQADGLMGEVASAKDEATKLSLAGRGSVDEDRLHQLERRVAELFNKVCKTDAE